ncbi:MAG: hypothetical protein ACM3NO_02190, partial [Deltaproteobacteria bacterium]
MRFRRLLARAVAALLVAITCSTASKLAQEGAKTIALPTSKVLLLPAPASSERTNSFPTAAALSP